MRYPFQFTSRDIARFFLIIGVYLGSILVLAIFTPFSDWFAAVLAIWIICSWFVFFAGTRSQFAELTPHALRFGFGFGPSIVIPYSIIREVKESPAGLLTPRRISLKLRRWKWLLIVTPVPIPIFSNRVEVPVGQTAELAQELMTRAGLLAR